MLTLATPSTAPFTFFCFHAVNVLLSHKSENKLSLIHIPSIKYNGVEFYFFSLGFVSLFFLFLFIHLIKRSHTPGGLSRHFRLYSCYNDITINFLTFFLLLHYLFYSAYYLNSQPKSFCTHIEATYKCLCLCVLMGKPVYLHSFYFLSITSQSEEDHS